MCLFWLCCVFLFSQKNTNVFVVLNYTCVFCFELKMFCYSKYILFQNVKMFSACLKIYLVGDKKAKPDNEGQSMDVVAASVMQGVLHTLNFCFKL